MDASLQAIQDRDSETTEDVRRQMAQAEGMEMALRKVLAWLQSHADVCNNPDLELQTSPFHSSNRKTSLTTPAHRRPTNKMPTLPKNKKIPKHRSANKWPQSP